MDGQHATGASSTWSAGTARARSQTWPIAGAIIPQSVHTITQTRDWLIVADCAFKVEPQVLAGGDRTEPANHVGPAST